LRGGGGGDKTWRVFGVGGGGGGVGEALRRGGMDDVRARVGEGGGSTFCTSARGPAVPSPAPAPYLSEPCGRALNVRRQRGQLGHLQGHVRDVGPRGQGQPRDGGPPAGGHHSLQAAAAAGTRQMVAHSRAAGGARAEGGTAQPRSSIELLRECGFTALLV
jgi:hypothetical protein